MKENLMERGLPKWPQMIVTGKKLPEDQALEIIRRTDNFFGALPLGNNHEFKEKALKILGRKSVADFYRNVEESKDYFESERQFEESWGYIRTEYVGNSFISCSYVGGPHGWVHPDGTIGYCDNVGKWPSVEEVYNDWAKLAEAFPFIEVEATLMNGEQGEMDIEPVVSFLIRNGQVELVDPKERNLHAEFFRTMPAERDFKYDLIRKVVYGDVSTENAISLDQIRKWAEQMGAKSE